MRRVWFVLLSTIVTASLPGCLVEETGSSRQPAVYTGHGRNHGQERREEVHERNAERKHEKKAKH